MTELKKKEYLPIAEDFLTKPKKDGEIMQIMLKKMKKNEMKLKKKEIARTQIADYAWLGKTQRSWHLWSGNPFCLSLAIIPLRYTKREDLIRQVIKFQKHEKNRFTKLFPDVKWDSISLTK